MPFFRVLRQSALCIPEVVAGGLPGLGSKQQHHSEDEQQNPTDGYHQLYLHPTTTAAFPKEFLKIVIPLPPMVSYNNKGFGVKRISSITPYIAAVCLWAKTLHVYEIRFPYLKDKFLVVT